MSLGEVFCFEFHAMGSPCDLSIHANDREEASRVADAAIDEVRRIERSYSRYRVDSLLSDINRIAKIGGGISVDGETAFLIDHAFHAYLLSDGLFDVTSGRMREIWNDEMEVAPCSSDIASLLKCVGLTKMSWREPQLTFSAPGMELDFGGIAKEYAADRAAAVCASAGLRCGLVNLGGDIAVIGAHPDGSPWRIGIRDPMGGDGAIATLFVANGAVATSGNYERYWEIDGRRFSHIINPKTGWPVEGMPSVTVVGETCMSAGMVSTIAMLKGQAGPEWLREIGAAHLYVEDTGKLGGSIHLEDHRNQLNPLTPGHCETAS